MSGFVKYGDLVEVVNSTELTGKLPRIVGVAYFEKENSDVYIREVNNKGDQYLERVFGPYPQRTVVLVATSYNRKIKWPVSLLESKIKEAKVRCEKTSGYSALPTFEPKFI